MSDEEKTAKSFASPDVLILTGQACKNLDKLVPPSCKAIISFGVCGGLTPDIKVAQVVVASHVISPFGPFFAEQAWTNRLQKATGAMPVTYYSSGLWDEANTQDQRRALSSITSAKVIDNETFGVASFSKKHGIPFAVMRSVSDDSTANIPMELAHAVNQDGTPNPMAALFYFIRDPITTLGIAWNYEKSLMTLRQAAKAAGPTFQA